MNTKYSAEHNVLEHPKYENAVSHPYTHYQERPKSLGSVYFNLYVLYSKHEEEKFLNWMVTNVPTISTARNCLMSAFH